jgi:hypothetical protein
VLKLTLATNAFSWAFLATDNSVLDSGTERTLDRLASRTRTRTATRLTATATGRRISGMLTSARP